MGWAGEESWRAQEIFLVSKASCGSEAHPASYLVDSRGSVCWIRVAKMWSWLLTSI